MLSPSWKSLRDACTINMPDSHRAQGFSNVTNTLVMLLEEKKKSIVVLLLQMWPFSGRDQFLTSGMQPWLWKWFLSGQQDSIGWNLFPLGRYNCTLPHLAWGFHLLCSVLYFRPHPSSSLFHRTRTRWQSIMTANWTGLGSQDTACVLEALGYKD